MKSKICVNDEGEASEYIESLWNIEDLKVIQKGLIDQFFSHGKIYMSFFNETKIQLREILRMMGPHFPCVIVPYPTSKFYLHAYFDPASENAEVSLHTPIKYQSSTAGDIVFVPRVSCKYWVNYDIESPKIQDNVARHNSIAEVVGAESFPTLEHTCSLHLNDKRIFFYTAPQDRAELLSGAPWTKFSHSENQGRIYDRLGEILSFKVE